MGSSLNPTVISRIARILRPDFTRTVLARRIAAGALVILAAIAALQPDSSQAHSKAVIAVHDLTAGQLLGANDVRVEQRYAATLPDGTHTEITDVIGTTLTSPVRRGEILTDARILGSRLAGLAAGPDARIVPLHLADAGLTDLIRPGDVVDVLGVPEGSTDNNPRVLAHHALVVLVSQPHSSTSWESDRVVLVALPARFAHTLAGATLIHKVTITLR